MPQNNTIDPVVIATTKKELDKWFSKNPTRGWTDNATMMLITNVSDRIGRILTHDEYVWIREQTMYTGPDCLVVDTWPTNDPNRSGQ